MTLMRWQRPELYWGPMRQWANLRDEIDRLFDSPASLLSEASQPFMGGWIPAVDVFEDNDNFVVKVEVPGIKKEELEISLHEGVLTLQGERKAQSKGNGKENYRSERFFGRFQRSISLGSPVQADKVSAKYADGILTVTLPKAEESKPRQIPISVK